MRPSSTYSQLREDGAYGANRNGEFFVEEQRHGESMIIAGLIKNNVTAFNNGLKAFDYAFNLLDANGAWSTSADLFHSSCLFLASICRTILMVNQSGQTAYIDLLAPKLPSYEADIRRSVDYLLQPSVWDAGRATSAPYTHRYYILSNLLSFASVILDDSSLLTKAEAEISAALALQRLDGVNPELGGHDSSYQMVGVAYASQWATYFPGHALTEGVVNMINSAIAWEATMILSDGKISSAGNTRTGGGQETTRQGAAKAVNHREVMQAHAYWAEATGDITLEQRAALMASYYYSSDTSVMNNNQNYLA